MNEAELIRAYGSLAPAPRVRHTLAEAGYRCRVEGSHTRAECALFHDADPDACLDCREAVPEPPAVLCPPCLAARLASRP